jgi:uncharacterized surface protein with fasciclin (FAS1) repeats
LEREWPGVRCPAISPQERTEKKGMKMRAFALVLASAALVAAGGCSKKDGNGPNGSPAAQTPKAQKAAGAKTIAAGLPANSRFMTVAKAAGLDQTLAGPGPYTVFVPDDAAFGQAPAGTFDIDPKNRPQLTSVLTNLILPGTVLVADIDKTIDAGKGKALLATVGTGTLTATKEGGKTVLADSSGHKATITQGDEQFTNGVVHHVDALLMPGKSAAAPVSVGQKAGK